MFLKSRLELGRFRWRKIRRTTKLAIYLVPLWFFLFWPLVFIPFILLLLDIMRVNKTYRKELSRVRNANS